MNTPPSQPEALNDRQRQAVRHQAQHLLIAAGPGTGKTHTLTHRIARVLETLPPGEKILAVTFTNKAAEHMRSRLEMLTPARMENLTIGTFHQFCLALLKDNSLFPGPNNLAIAPDTALSTYTRRHKLSRDATARITEAKSTITDGVFPEDVRRYNDWLRSEGWLDYDDLLLEALALLQNEPAVRASVRRIWTRIFIDEYQDINPVQHALIRQIKGSRAPLTAIGDPNQAIYGFRGSDVSIFHRFTRDFPEAAVLSLEENYRSADELLKASYQVIARQPELKPTPLIATLYARGCLTVHESATDKAEAEYVVHQIEKLVGGTSLFSQDSGRVDTALEGTKSFGNIAVLFRLKQQARVLKEAFERSGMPYHLADQIHAQDDWNDESFKARPDEPEMAGEKVSLMTLHAAKGLEFDVVFIIGCEEGILPLDMEGLRGQPDEECRLFYVGMTRARERLYLTAAKKRLLYGRTLKNPPSRFLARIEEQLKSIEPSATGTKKKKKKDNPQLTLFGNF